MTKILVDDMPLKAKECPFAEYIHMTSKHACMLKSGMYSRCNLECDKACDKLKEANKKSKKKTAQETESTGWDNPPRFNSLEERDLYYK